MRPRGAGDTVETFLLVFAAIFPVVNPPGAALIFLGMTQGASSQTRRWLARRVAVNAFVIMILSLTVGALVLKIYGISIPVVRVAGGLIVAVAGWKLLNEENSKAADETASKERNTDFRGVCPEWTLVRRDSSPDVKKSEGDPGDQHRSKMRDSPEILIRLSRANEGPGSARIRPLELDV